MPTLPAKLLVGLSLCVSTLFCASVHPPWMLQVSLQTSVSLPWPFTGLTLSSPVADTNSHWFKPLVPPRAWHSTVAQRT